MLLSLVLSTMVGHKHTWALCYLPGVTFPSKNQDGDQQLRLVYVVGFITLILSLELYHASCKWRGGRQGLTC